MIFVICFQTTTAWRPKKMWWQEHELYGNGRQTCEKKNEKKELCDM